MSCDGDTTVIIGTDTVVLERRGRSAPVVARILEWSADAHGAPAWILCDRRIHYPREDQLGEFRAYGAVTTELVRDG